MSSQQAEEIGALAAMVFQHKEFINLTKVEQKLCTRLQEQLFLVTAPYSGNTGKLTNKSKEILLQLLGVSL